MLRFKYIEMRNFLSFGNVPQRVELNSSPLTLVMGVNNDASGEANGEETRNGVGKSSMMQALNFALYGKSIDNRIKLSNLVNKTNKKNCSVTVEFEKDGVDYKIIRSRSPTNVHLFVNNTEVGEVKDDVVESDDDEAQGENRATQEVILDIIGMSQELFTQIVTLTTSDEPFLGKSGTKQRQLIEELLTITQLSEKAEKLKELSKNSAEAIKQEKFRVDTLQTSNGKILETIKGFEAQSSEWETTKENSIIDIKNKLEEYPPIDVDLCIKEIEAVVSARYNNKTIEDMNAHLDGLVKSAVEFNEKQTAQVAQLDGVLASLKTIDIDQEIRNHTLLEGWGQENRQYEASKAELASVINDSTRINTRIIQIKGTIKRLNEQLDGTVGSTCPTCKNQVDHEKHLLIIDSIKTRIKTEEDELAKTEVERETAANKAEELANNLKIPGPQPTTHYNTVAEAYQHQANIVAVENEIKNISATPNNSVIEAEKLIEELKQKEVIEIVPSRFTAVHDVYKYENTRNRLIQSLEAQENSTNPYTQQIDTLRTSSLQVIDYEELNRLRKLQEHQDFLVKLLTNKNSFVRKRIIEQNLSFLNARLAHYIAKSGAPHTVTFMNDLSVDISYMGNNYDYDNLSRGEKTRVVIALTLAFRDTFESLNFAINTLLLDEYLDQGLDNQGANDCYKMLAELSDTRDKNCFLITHRSELQQKANTIMTIVKENGFSTVEQNEGEAL